MTRKVIPILILIALLVTIWITNNSESSHPATEELNTTTQNRPVLTSANDTKIKPNLNPDSVETTTPIPSSTTDNQEQATQITELTTELSGSRYSEDPVIELTSIIMEISGCDISRTFSRWNYLKPSPQWQQLNQQAEQDCQKMKQQYPLIANEKNTDRYFKLLKPTTLLGKQLYDTYDQLENSPDDAMKYINDIYYIGVSSKNAQLISMAKLFSTAGLNRNEEIFPYHQLLQTEDNQYIRLIDQLALEAMACSYSNGVTCQPQNYNMLDRCRQVVEVCGLNFNQWFDTYVSIGIKTDVNILIEYYQQINL